MTVPKHYYICLCLQHAVNTCGYQRGEMNSDQTAGKLNSTIPFSRTEMKLKRRRSSGVGKKPSWCKNWDGGSDNAVVRLAGNGDAASPPPENVTVFLFPISPGQLFRKKRRGRRLSGFSGTKIHPFFLPLHPPSAELLFIYFGSPKSSSKFQNGPTKWFVDLEHCSNRLNCRHGRHIRTLGTTAVRGVIRATSYYLYHPHPGPNGPHTNKYKSTNGRCP